MFTAGRFPTIPLSREEETVLLEVESQVASPGPCHLQTLELSGQGHIEPQSVETSVPWKAWRPGLVWALLNVITFQSEGIHRGVACGSRQVLQGCVKIHVCMNSNVICQPSPSPSLGCQPPS